MTTDITRLTAREILDSRGQPTIEVTIAAGAIETQASVPSGKSTGRREAAERRDHDPHRYGGQGVLQAVEAVNGEIAGALVGQPLPSQNALDRFLCMLDGTPNKSRLGANAILGVSLAAARLWAVQRGVPLYNSLGGPDAALLPVPCFNVINGGAHAPNALDFQEFMLAPAGFPTFAEALRAGAETYRALAKLLDAAGLSTAVGDEGGFAPALRYPEEALDWIMRAIEKAGHAPGERMFIVIDPAANGFSEDPGYRVADAMLSADQLIDRYSSWLGHYPILSIEDGLAEDDIDGWQSMTERLGDRVQIMGDDIFVSAQARVEWAIEHGLANAVLLKPNQVGTLSELIDTAGTATAAGYHTMMSHRSGETTDAFIADLAVALGTGQIKSGAPARGERVAKYNRLLAIEAELGPRARYAGFDAFRAAARTTGARPGIHPSRV